VICGIILTHVNLVIDCLDTKRLEALEMWLMENTERNIKQLEGLEFYLLSDAERSYQEIVSS